MEKQSKSRLSKTRSKKENKEMTDKNTMPKQNAKDVKSESKLGTPLSEKKDINGTENLAKEEIDEQAQEKDTPTKSETKSPAKKRMRLSLKGTKAVQKLTSYFGADASPREGSTAPASDDKTVLSKPCVAALHNLGNTCFLNSVLQVLRHTPGFMAVLDVLHKEILSTEDLQDHIVAETDNEEEDDEIMTWTLVKALAEVFEKMKIAEEKYKAGTSHYLAVRPYDLMTAIERINPMFEGNMQHDVHELLRCLLAYMQDAVRELNKLRSKYHQRYGKNGTCIKKLESMVKIDLPGVAADVKQNKELDNEKQSEDERNEDCVKESDLEVIQNVNVLKSKEGNGIIVNAKQNGDGAKENDELIVPEVVRKTKLGRGRPKKSQSDTDIKKGKATKEDESVKNEEKCAKKRNKKTKSDDESEKTTTKTPPARKRLSKKDLAEKSGQRQLNSYFSSPGSNDKGLANGEKSCQENGETLTNGGTLINENSPKKYPRSPRKNPAKDVYAMPEKSNISATASSPVTPKQFYAKHRLIPDKDPKNGDLPGKDDADEILTTFRKDKSASLPSLDKVNGEEQEEMNGKENEKKSNRKTKTDVQGGNKRKLSSETENTKTTKGRGRARKSAEPEENGTNSRSKLLNGKSNNAKTQPSVLSMLTNPAPRKRLGMRGTVLRQGLNTDEGSSHNDDEVSFKLRVEDQLDGCCDDPNMIKDDINCQNSNENILDYSLSDSDLDINSDLDDVDIQINQSSEEDEIVYSQSDFDALDSSDCLTDESVSLSFSDSESGFHDSQTDNDSDSESESTAEKAIKRQHPKSPYAVDDSSQSSCDSVVCKKPKTNVNDSNSSDTNDSQSKEVTYIEMNTSTEHSDSHFKEMKYDDMNSLTEQNSSKECTKFELQDIPQFDGSFDDWGTQPTKTKQTARKTCLQDRLPFFPDKLESQESDAILETKADAENQIKEAVVNQAVVKLFKEDIPTYMQQKKVASLQQQVALQSDVGDCIKTIFEGDMALRTRCMECESYTERKEAYQDISVAVKKDKQHCDEDDLDDKNDQLEWLRSALADVENLRGDNKYFCDKCLRLVEAQRSMHYVTMPNILTLHLKRFAATNGYFGGLTKITDHVTTPLQLPCLQDKCASDCSDPHHKYELYGIITHTGISISSGHYVAYIKTDNNNLPQEDTPDSDKNNENVHLPMATDNGLADPNNNQDSNNNLDANDIMPNQNTIQDTDNNSAIKSGPQWLECDDDSVRLLSQEEFQNILSSSGAGTPYMLFYHSLMEEFSQLQIAS